MPRTPEWTWAALCLDEALHYHHSSWENTRAEESREEPGGDTSGGRNLYDQHTRDPRLGRPPSQTELSKLPRVEDEPAADARHR